MTIRGEAPQNKRNPHQMGDKTFNHVEIKPEMTLCHSTFMRPPRSYFYINKVLLLHQQVLTSCVVYITMANSYGHKYGALQRQRQHTYTQDIHNSKSVIEGKLVHLRKKIIVIITRPIQPKSNKEEKRQRQRQPRHGHHRLAPQQPAFDHQPPSSHQSPPHQATHPHSHP